MSGNTSTDIWIAGAAGAFTVDLLVYPLDTIKTRIQSTDYKRLYASNRPALFRGLYQGVGSVILATLPSSGAFFTTYEGAKSFLEAYPLPTPLVYALASGLGEAVSCAILTPAEVIKQNAQMVSVSSSASPSATAQTLARFRQNPRALFSGYGALLGRNLPFTALQFPLYEHLRANFARRRSAAHGQGRAVVGRALDTAAAGAIAGGAAALVTTPVDVVKTRVMLAAASSSGASAQEAVKAGKVVDALGGVSSSSGAKSHRTSHATRGMLAVARDVLRQDGWRGLWRGGALRTSFAALGSGLYLATYESARVWLLRRDGEEP